jgi:hypothetical protein
VFRWDSLRLSAQCDGGLLPSMAETAGVREAVCASAGLNVEGEEDADVDAAAWVLTLRIDEDNEGDAGV